MISLLCDQRSCLGLYCQKHKGRKRFHFIQSLPIILASHAISRGHRLLQLWTKGQQLKTCPVIRVLANLDILEISKIKSTNSLSCWIFFGITRIFFGWNMVEFYWIRYFEKRCTLPIQYYFWQLKIPSVSSISMNFSWCRCYIC